MARFVVQWEYSADRDTRYAARPEHRAHLGALAERGIVLAAGPLADDTGGIVVFDTSDAEELRGHLAADPYTKAGVIVKTTVTEWNPALGAWLA
ncbi:YciI family protein [Allokutzneria multivorans]|uniref:YciI family protein n=1 Tax=Allokutzneria multivorans TaxID=1142134 RepID=A0ABP7RJH9_9PSEU